MEITNLKQERINREWTLEFVGQQVGISNQAMSLIEKLKSKPSYDVLVKLEKLFHKSHHYLFAQVGDSQHPDYSKNVPDGEAEARELYDAADGLRIDAGLVLDVAKDGRLDDLKDREMLVRARDAINAVLGEVA